jgi:hypothetical protein
MSNTILVKSRTCTVCGEYEVWSLDRQAVESWQAGENIQNAFPDMNAGDREILISGTHPACWKKLFPKEDEDEYCDVCQVEETHLSDMDCYAYEKENGK